MTEFIGQLQEMLVQMSGRIDALEHTVNEVIIQSLREAHEQYEHDSLIDHIKAHEEITALGDRLKPLYGDDFDVVESLAEAVGTHKGEDGFDEESYIAEQIADVNAKLDAMMGVTGEPVVEETVTEETTDATGGEEPTEEIPSEEQLAAELQAAK